ncbi:multiubiquitin domain-containing protein [Mesorhizobium sp. M0659]|uniref:multiubiquitin domain-containing protein n=1 Tax=Mesorhizobium sp. M0659 TaxID=2956980 RepID=UPI0033353D6B
MNSPELNDYDDVGDAIAEGRALRPARAYRIRFAQDGLDFTQLLVSDPVPLGRQVIEAAGLDPRKGYSLFAIIASGDFEDVRLDEAFDLRGNGAERFVAFLTDRDYKFEMNGREMRWGKPVISGRELAKLAKPGPDEAVFLDVRDGTDRMIEPFDLIELSAPGIERFVTAPRPPIEIIVNTRKKLVRGPTITFEDIVALAFPGPHDSNVVFSMTYRKAASTPHSGELGQNGSITIKQGTVFNVTRTVQS